LLASAAASPAGQSAIPESSPKFQVEWNLADVLIEAYDRTDWSPVTTSLLSNPGDEENAKVFLVPLALGNAFLNRYGMWKDPADSERALQYFEAVADGYALWNRRLLTPTITHALVVSVDRMHVRCDDHWDLPVVQRKRAANLWKNVKSILREEAGYRLDRAPSETNEALCLEEESRAEADGWEAALFADAASFLEDEAEAPAWDDRTGQLVQNAAAHAGHGCGSELGDGDAALLALRQVTLSHRAARPRTVLKFRPVVDELVKISDRDDSADAMDKSAEFRKQPVKPVPVMTTGSDLLQAVQNSKNLVYSVLATYLSHLPEVSECSETRHTMPEVGEVR
jgi:hypothetical protein